MSMTFLEMEAAIIDRLNEKLGNTVSVLTADELEDLANLRQKAPAVFVIYDGFTVEDSPPGARLAKMRINWFIVAADKSAKGGGKNREAREKADAMAGQVLAALIGFNLGGGRILTLADSPGIEFDNGFVFIPLSFSTTATFHGDK